MEHVAGAGAALGSAVCSSSPLLSGKTSGNQDTQDEGEVWGEASSPDPPEPVGRCWGG